MGEADLLAFVYCIECFSVYYYSSYVQYNMRGFPGLFLGGFSVLWELTRKCAQGKRELTGVGGPLLKLMMKQLVKGRRASDCSSFLAPASASSVSLCVLWQEVAYTHKTSLESNHISKTWEK